MKIDGRDNAYIGKVYRESIASSDEVRQLRQSPAPQNTAREGENSKETISEEVIRTPRRNTDISDIKVSLGNRDSSLVGLSNLGGIQSSIMRKAVSDMQKDSVLHEYQYFVGTGAVNGRVVMSDDDGVVVRR